MNPVSNWLNATDTPSIGPEIRAGRPSVAELNKLVNVQTSKLGPEKLALLRSLVLLWHDHLDESHTISQGLDGPDGSYLHGIMHRREPDYGNARYWFRRVGNHPALERVAELAGENTSLDFFQAGRLDAFAFIDACEAADTESRRKTLQGIQQFEFQALLERITGP